MKKAYVKPVFVADEYELTASVASCEGYSSSTPYEVWKGTIICNHTTSHVIGQGSGKDPVNDYWSYATDGFASSYDDPNYTVDGMDANHGAYVFSGSETQCDFVWTSYTGKIGIWKDAQGNQISNMNDRENEGSWIDNTFGEIQYTFMEFFRKASASCPPAFGKNEGNGVQVVVPFS